MNKKQIEMYKFYHGLYPSVLLLFHPGGGYVAMLEDAHRAAEILDEQFCVVDDKLKIPDKGHQSIGEAGRQYRVQYHRLPQQQW